MRRIEPMRRDGAIRIGGIMLFGSREEGFYMQTEILAAERVRWIVGGFFDVYNYYGYGLSERVYAGALEARI
jgi:hypothetical protein